MIRVLRLRARSFGEGPSRGSDREARPGRVLDAEALASIGIDLDEVRRCVERAFGEGALERTRAGRRPR
jgi:hypothetical protein